MGLFAEVEQEWTDPITSSDGIPRLDPSIMPYMKGRLLEVSHIHDDVLLDGQGIQASNPYRR